MAYSGRGKPGADLNETLVKLKHLQQISCRNPHLYFGIFLKNSDGSEGELIGDGGVHKIGLTHTEWSEFGYKFRKEYWGFGYATEFVCTFMQFWWNLPRMNARIEVALCSTAFLGMPKALEIVYAWTTVNNT